MSIQARLLRQALRIGRKALTDVDSPEHLRARLERLTRRMPPPPSDLKFMRADLGGCQATWVSPLSGKGLNGLVVLYLHGGGYVFCSAGTTHRDLMSRLARAAGATVVGVDYRLAPEHRFPAAVEDAVAAYEELLSRGFAPRSIAIAGDSAGGGLTFGALLKMRDMGLPLPAAAVGISPWTDLAITGSSLASNLKRDMLIPGDRLQEGVSWYLGSEDPLNPYASPLYGDHKGLPPSLIMVGGDEVLLDDSIRLADRMTQAGVAVELEVWPGMQHVWPVFAPILPEGVEAIMRIGGFLRRYMSLA